PGEDGDIRSVFCISGSKGWLARDQRHIKNAPAQLFHTEDGGETWHRQKLPGYKTDLEVVYFRDEKEGWAAGSENESASADGLKAILLHTVDGGQTWKREEVGAQELDFQAVYFSDPLTGWLVGYDKVFRTDDGGANWRLVLNVHATTAKN